MKTLHLLVSRGPSDQDSYRLQFMGKQLVTTRCALNSWMQFCGKRPTKYCNVCCSHVTYAFSPPFSLLSNGKMTSMSRAAVHQWTMCRNARLLYNAPSSADRSKGIILPFGTKSKCYSIRWHSLWREGCIVNVRQLPLGTVVILEESSLCDRCVCVYSSV